MSDRFPTQIQIGGNVSRNLLPALMKAINEEQLQNAWGNGIQPIATEEQLLDCIEDDHLYLCDDERAWGEFTDLERFLVEKKIAFDRSHGPRYEYSGELVLFRPGMEAPACAICNDSGTLLVEIEEVQKARDMLKACHTLPETQEVVAALDALCAEADIEPLPPFEIVD